jgi:hypothetical protein
MYMYTNRAYYTHILYTHALSYFIISHWLRHIYKHTSQLVTIQATYITLPAANIYTLILQQHFPGAWS